MNRDNIQLLIDTIINQPHTGIDDKGGFNMLKYEHECGTPACIGGWAASLSSTPDIYLCSREKARRWLEIDDRTANNLFIVSKDVQPGADDHVMYTHLSRITPTEAVKALQNLLDDVDKDNIWDHLTGEWY